MLVSVVVPTFNEEKCLEKCLSSLADGKTEIIVVDGGSTDNTLKIARKYTTKVFNLNKRGIGIARQFGAENAKGKYIYMTDSDCWSSPQLLQRMVRVLERNSAIAVTGPTRYFGVHGKIIQIWYYIVDRYLFEYKYGIFCLSGRNSLVRRDKLLKAIKGTILPSFWEDGVITLKLKNYGKMTYDNSLYNFSLERRLSNLRTLIKTAIAYIKCAREFAKKGNITSCQLPVTSGRNS